MLMFSMVGSPSGRPYCSNSVSLAGGGDPDLIESGRRTSTQAGPSKPDCPADGAYSKGFGRGVALVEGGRIGILKLG